MLEAAEARAEAKAAWFRALRSAAWRSPARTVSAVACALCAALRAAIGSGAAAAAPAWAWARSAVAWASWPASVGSGAPAPAAALRRLDVRLSRGQLPAQLRPGVVEGPGLGLDRVEELVGWATASWAARAALAASRLFGGVWARAALPFLICVLREGASLVGLLGIALDRGPARRRVARERLRGRLDGRESRLQIVDRLVQGRQGLRSGLLEVAQRLKSLVLLGDHGPGGLAVGDDLRCTSALWWADPRASSRRAAGAA